MLFTFRLREHWWLESVTETTHKKGQPQNVTDKEAVIRQDAISKHFYRKVIGRKNWG